MAGDENGSAPDDAASTDDNAAPLPDVTTSMVLTKDGDLEPRTFDIPDVSEGGALLDVEMTSVCGTDVGIYGGESHFDTLPLVFGHEVVGRVVAGHDETLDRPGSQSATGWCPSRISRATTATTVRAGTTICARPGARTA